jgi:hypothetical protein
MTDREAYLPWNTEGDDPDDWPVMTPEQNETFARNIAAAFPELIDHSEDGPIKPETEQQRVERIRNDERHGEGGTIPTANVRRANYGRGH